MGEHTGVQHGRCGMDMRVQQKARGYTPPFFAQHILADLQQVNFGLRILQRWCELLRPSKRTRGDKEGGAVLGNESRHERLEAHRVLSSTPRPPFMNIAPPWRTQRCTRNGPWCRI
jgi:hypothetical protein